MTKPVIEPAASQVYVRLLAYLRPHIVLVIMAFAAMLLVATSQTGLAAVMKPLLDKSFVARDAHSIRTLPLVIIALFVLRGLATFVSTYTMSYVGRRVIQQLRSDTFSHLLRLLLRLRSSTRMCSDCPHSR